MPQKSWHSTRWVGFLVCCSGWHTQHFYAMKHLPPQNVFWNLLTFSAKEYRICLHIGIRIIDMCHVFALSYHSTGFLCPTLEFFHCFASRECVHCTLCMRSEGTFAFKFLQINRYMKWSGTWNMFLFLVRWQEFLSFFLKFFFCFFVF